MRPRAQAACQCSNACDHPRRGRRSLPYPGLEATLTGRVDDQRAVRIVRPDDEAELVATAELIAGGHGLTTGRSVVPGLARAADPFAVCGSGVQPPGPIDREFGGSG